MLCIHSILSISVSLGAVYAKYIEYAKASMGKDTTVRVSEETLDRLFEEKENRRDSYDDVINRVIDERDELRERVSRLEEVLDDRGETVGAFTERRDEPLTDDQDTLVDDVEETPSNVPSHAVDDLELPGSGPRLEQRREAMHAVMKRLAENGETSPSELRELYHEVPAGYDGQRSWWKNLVLPALKELKDRGVVELVDPHDGTRRLTREYENKT